MGRRGPAPKPTALKMRQGNPGKRAINQGEPKPRAAAPRVPPHLAAEARACWKRTVRILSAANLMTVADQGILALYCQAWARWVSAEEQVEKIGEVVKTKSGNLIQNPYLSVANRAMDQMLVYGRELGLSPSSRTRLSVKIEEPRPSLAETLFQMAVKQGAQDFDD